MKKPLREEMENHYQEKRLSLEQLRELNLIQRSAKKRRPPLMNSFAWGAALAAVILLGVFSFWSKTVTVQDMATEVAYNHNKRLEPEFFSAKISFLQNSLQKLDFTLVDSVQLPTSLWSLVGGRYCKLDGRIAAQLKLTNKENGMDYTLYQVRINEKWDLQQLKDLQLNSDGVVVKFWMEKGVLMALAGPS